MANDLRLEKKIYELEQLAGNLSDDTWIPLAKDNLTRRASLLLLKRYLNGDNDEPSTTNFYSSFKINGLFTDVYNTLAEMNSEITTIDNNYDYLLQLINSNYTTLNGRITQEVNDRVKAIEDEAEAREAADEAEAEAREAADRAEAKTRSEADQALDKKINDEVTRSTAADTTHTQKLSEHEGRLNGIDATLTHHGQTLNTHNDILTNHTARIDTLERDLSALTTKVASLITYGATAPNAGNIPVGGIYIQFID